MVRKRPPGSGFHEPPDPVDTWRPTGLARLETSARVLDAYRHACTATRQVFQPMAGAAGLAVIPIRPIDLGGSYDFNNLLPFCADVAAAFQSGDFTIGADLELVVDLRRIDPGILRRLNSDGEILLPTDRALWPDLDNLRYHRELIFLPFAG